MNYTSVGGGDDSGGAGLTVQGLPLVKPPWGRITAIDLNKGDLVWQIAHGRHRQRRQESSRAERVDIPRTGDWTPAKPGGIGTLVTKTLVIAGEGGVFTTSGQRAPCCAHRRRRQEVGAVYMPGANRRTDDLHVNGSSI